MPLKVHDQAPDFTLPDQNGDPVTLSNLQGRWTLVYFYPKDDTPGCTKEACGVRDQWPAFTKANLAVLGISPDSEASHMKFREKFKLTFPLLVDEEKKVVQLYGVWGPKKFMGKEYLGVIRTSFLIDPRGKIAKIYPKVEPEGHALEVLEDLRHLAAAQV